MANEFAFQLQMNLLNGDLKDNFSTGAYAVSQASAKMVRNVQLIPTGATPDALDLGGVVTPGVFYLVNLDDTNFVEIGTYTSMVWHPFLRLKAGEKWVGRFAVAAPYALAGGSAVELDYRIYDD
jgi:hypothetical protein